MERPTGATSPTGDAHPGAVAFEDESDGRSWTEDAAGLPQTIAWAEAEDGGWAPVTRVVRSGPEVTRYGEDGGVLDITVQRPPPRPPAPPTDPVPQPD